MGGPSKAAETIGVHRTRVHSWLRSGAIPPRHWNKIIDTTNGAVTPSDLLPAAVRL
ncbi:MAG: helix-turn-helix domain-containing protein [Proteobacteria bacterium]|nr:helix-turn-helix domain-containing protein [Pseudomonadota bacterium]